MNTRAIFKLQPLSPSRSPKKRLSLQGNQFLIFFRGRSVTLLLEIAVFNMQVLPQNMRKCVIGTFF